MNIVEFVDKWEAIIRQAEPEVLEDLYKLKFTLTLENDTIEIPFDAVAYNHIMGALVQILEENGEI